MEFKEQFISSLDKKYQEMLHGDDSLLKINDLSSCSEFTKNNDTYHNRLNEEYNKIRDSIAEIKRNRDNRIKAQKDVETQKRMVEQKAIQQEKEKKERLLRIIFFPFVLVYYLFYGIYVGLKELFTSKSGQTVLQFLSYISPIVLSIVFAIILFANKEQIGIVSNFGGWCTGWVFFLIASLVVSIILLKKRFADWDCDDTSSKVSAVIVAILMVISSIVVFSNSGKLSSNFDPTTFITFNVTGKTTSTSYSKYYSTISFNLKNNSDVKVTYICGEMKLYNGSTEVGCWNVYFNGEYEGGKSYTTTVEFDETNTASLYNTSYTNLGVTYRITSMKFNGDYKEYEYNGQIVTLKAIGDTSASENNYKEAVSLYNQGKYEEAQVIFKSLGDYKDSAWYADQCENKAFYQTMESYLHNVAGTNAILPDNYTIFSYSQSKTYYYNYDYYDAFFIDFEVPSSKANTYQTAYVQKLLNNGFTQIDANTFKKGVTMIHFDDVEYGYSNYYMNFYAWKIN